MRYTAAVLWCFVASALACHLERKPDNVDHFIRYRSTGPQDGEQLYTLEFEDRTTRQVTDEERWAIKRAHIRFIDITYEPDQMSINSFASNVQAAAFPTTLTQKSAVNALIPKYNITNVKTTLTKFSSFYNRYYKSKFGAESAQWLFDQISAIATSSGVKGVTVRKFTHSFADQFSIIATLPGKSTKTIVLGAHQDSINVQTPSTGQAQGADDDGTGSMAIMEAFKTMLTDPRLKSREADNTIEFHWYAGEEAGLLGSQAVFQQYAKAGTNIAAMLQSDMVGYSNGPMGVITDFTNDALNTFTRRVIEQYTTTGYVDSECGYGCSDHASATRAGYPSSFIFEAAFEESNPDIHTPRDTIDKVDFAHVLEHGKLMLGWAMELAFSPSI